MVIIYNLLLVGLYTIAAILIGDMIPMEWISYYLKSENGDLILSLAFLGMAVIHYAMLYCGVKKGLVHKGSVISLWIVDILRFGVIWLPLVVLFALVQGAGVTGETLHTGVFYVVLLCLGLRVYSTVQFFRNNKTNHKQQQQNEAVKKKTRKLSVWGIVLGWLALSLAGLFYMFISRPADGVPQSGTWYCEELQTQLCFDKDYSAPIEFYEEKGYEKMDDEEYYRSYIMIDGQKFRCAVGNRGISVFITYSDLKFNEENYEFHPIGQNLFEGETQFLSKTKFVLKDSNTGKEYIFRRAEYS